MTFSTFRLVARALIQLRDNFIDFGSFDLSVGLLSGCPTPEGTNLQEIDIPGYRRQNLSLGPAPGPAGARSPRSLGAVDFAAHFLRSVATHGAIFDVDGRLLAYGWLQPTGGTDPHSVAFGPSEIQLTYH